MYVYRSTLPMSVILRRLTHVNRVRAARSVMFNYSCNIVGEFRVIPQ